MNASSLNNFWRLQKMQDVQINYSLEIYFSPFWFQNFFFLNVFWGWGYHSIPISIFCTDENKKEKSFQCALVNSTLFDLSKRKNVSIKLWKEKWDTWQRQGELYYFNYFHRVWREKNRYIAEDIVKMLKKTWYYKHRVPILVILAKRSQ